MRAWATCHPNKIVAGRGLCKSCYEKALRSENPEKFQLRQRVSYEKNRERIIARIAESRALVRALIIPEVKKCRNCGDQFSARKNRIYCTSRCNKTAWRKRNPSARRQDYLKNIGKYKARGRAWGLLNAKRKQARNRQWRLNNLEHCLTKERIRNHAERARKLAVSTGNPETIVVWEKAWKAKVRVRCYWCQRSFSPQQCHADHIAALSRGGAHDISNLCISCARCNMHKSAKPISEWNTRIVSPILL